MRKKSIYYV